MTPEPASVVLFGLGSALAGMGLPATTGKRIQVGVVSFVSA